MAAVASNHKPEGFCGSNSEQFTESGPSFTAVNGSASAAQSGHKDHSDESNGLPTPPINQQPRAKSPVPASSRPSQASNQPERVLTPQNPSVDNSNSTPSSTVAPMGVPPSKHASAQRHETNEDTNASYGSSHSRTPSSHQSKTANTSPQKRKRSYSEDYENTNNTPTYHSHALPNSPERQRMYPSESGPAHKQETASPPSSYPPPPEHGRPQPPELYPRPERVHMARDDYNPRVDPSIAPAPPRPYYSTDARMAEVLQRENRNYDNVGPRETFVSPEEEDEHHAQQYGEYGANRGSQSGLDLDRKRRKRVFSNRTKTGCMTCRRRKKKCDEQHPECNNCLRGGFVCEGYTMRNTWQKPADNKLPVPLQSKHGQGYPPIQRAPYNARYSSELSPEYSGSLPSHYPGSDGDRVKPILLDEEQDMNSRSSPPNIQPKPPYSKVSRPYPSNPPHLSKYQAEADHRTGSSHEIPYDSQDQNSMHAPAPHTPAPLPPPNVHRNSSSHSQYSTPPSQAPSQSANSNNVQVATQALQHYSSSSHRPSSHRRVELTEREKMLKGNYYHPFSPALVEDREKCIAAIWRFNNATNPSHGASPEERARLFRAIIHTTPTPEPNPNVHSDGTGSIQQPSISMPTILGSVGKHVVVEAPFHCDYGYNITIGDDVLIGADCRISDTCAVSIGSRTIFSPSVRLVCATYPIDPQRRNGSSGPALGRNIVIEEDCWIGCGVIILAGVKVGKSSTVGAGSLLHQDVPPFTVVAGNPAKFSDLDYPGSVPRFPLPPRESKAAKSDIILAPFKDAVANPRSRSRARLSLISRHLSQRPVLELNTPFSTERHASQAEDVEYIPFSPPPPPPLSSVVHPEVATVAKMSSQQLHPTLLIPGPVEFDDEVLRSMSHYSESHVSAPFVSTFGETLTMLRKLLVTSDTSSQPFVISGSGTLGWDIVAANLAEPGDEILVLHTGYFADSFADCFMTYGAVPTQLKAPIGDRPQLPEIADALRAKHYKLITVTHVDTSTAVLSDIKELSELVHRVSPETLVVVDGVCSVGSEEIQFDQWGIDVVLTASQKAIGCPAGLCIVMCSGRAIECFKNRKQPPGSYFASFKNWLPIMQNYEAKKPSYFATPSPQLIHALHTALTQILSRPLSDRFATHKEVSKRIKSTVASLGLKQLASKAENQANGMTAIYLPDGVNAAEILPSLLKKGVIFAGGLHKEIAAKYIRIGHMGVSVMNPQRGDVDRALEALKTGLAEVGYSP